MSWRYTRKPDPSKVHSLVLPMNLGWMDEDREIGVHFGYTFRCIFIMEGRRGAARGRRFGGNVRRRLDEIAEQDAVRREAAVFLREAPEREAEAAALAEIEAAERAAALREAAALQDRIYKAEERVLVSQFDKDVCPICYEQLRYSAGMCPVPCGHGICLECSKTWVPKFGKICAMSKCPVELWVPFKKSFYGKKK